MLNTMMETENTSFASILFLRSCLQRWSPEHDLSVFIFHHSIQYDEASGYTFYNVIDCPNQYIQRSE